LQLRLLRLHGPPDAHRGIQAEVRPLDHPAAGRLLPDRPRARPEQPGGSTWANFCLCHCFPAVAETRGLGFDLDELIVGGQDCGAEGSTWANFCLCHCFPAVAEGGEPVSCAQLSAKAEGEAQAAGPGTCADLKIPSQAQQVMMHMSEDGALSFAREARTPAPEEASPRLKEQARAVQRATAETEKYYWEAAVARQNARTLLGRYQALSALSPTSGPT